MFMLNGYFSYQLQKQGEQGLFHSAAILSIIGEKDHFCDDRPDLIQQTIENSIYLGLETFKNIHF